MTAIRNIVSGAPDSRPLPARPLSARSLVASLLLGMDRPERVGADLVRWCGLFGVPAGTARVALSRMVDAGELRARDGRYELVGRVRARSGEHDVARHPAVSGGWNGEWVIAVVTADGRSSEARAALRDELRRARYAEQREGVWTRPDNLVEARLVERERQCRVWRGRPDGDPAELGEALFAPSEWQAQAIVLEEWLPRATASLRRDGDGVSDAGAALADAFLAGTRALAHLRADPLLPPALLPAGWAGDALRQAYDEFQPCFDSAVAAWFRGARQS
ncbi:MAG TPA: PaaX family transcriptional regulator C-terminal domain-containing protein [Acidimicrobiia bacterium]